VQFTLRQDPGVTASAVLAVLVHLFFLSVLVFGVRWQTRQADSIAVELWTQLPPMEQAAPARVEPVPVPKPEPKVEPPPPEPKAVPKPEPKAEAKPVKPDIAVEKAPPKKTEPKKAEPRPEPKIDQRKLLREQLERETQQVSRDREKQEITQQLAREASAAQSRAVADYVGRIRGKIKGNIVMPADMPAGNPEAIFDVVQIPSGEVISAKLRKSSGYKPYDDAVERAILKASPLPKPDRSELFQRNLELKFKPLD
jgi:colicin import membrane protein